MTAKLNWFFNNGDLHSSIPIATFALLLSIYLALRFADSLMALFSFLALLSLIVMLAIYHLSFGASILPFLVMLISAVVYYFFFICRQQTEICTLSALLTLSANR
ncbi:hypothetical protein TH53_17355 [Pedobacter lusitanus]|uniref:Uncharacterized protein n=1 Tax=Pedobacter lusitanus TaxID=1503925 RepID=A0A0D0GNL0_9SPHI|nr:hypothetical protein TH53_17355 [Pedobacter lusitanus]